MKKKIGRFKRRVKIVLVLSARLSTTLPIIIIIIMMMMMMTTTTTASV